MTNTYTLFAFVVFVSDVVVCICFCYLRICIMCICMFMWYLFFLSHVLLHFNWFVFVCCIFLFDRCVYCCVFVFVVWGNLSFVVFQTNFSSILCLYVLLHFLHLFVYILFVCVCIVAFYIICDCVYCCIFAFVYLHFFMCVKRLSCVPRQMFSPPPERDRVCL